MKILMHLLIIIINSISITYHLWLHSSYFESNPIKELSKKKEMNDLEWWCACMILVSRRNSSKHCYRNIPGHQPDNKGNEIYNPKVQELLNTSLLKPQQLSASNNQHCIIQQIVPYLPSCHNQFQQSISKKRE